MKMACIRRNPVIICDKLIIINYKNHSVEMAVTILDDIHGFPSFQGEHLDIFQRLVA